MKRRKPTNSLGLPWRRGQTWSCAVCEASGDDRDDLQLPECTRRGGFHDLVFAPPAHAAAIKARQLALPLEGEA